MKIFKPLDNLNKLDDSTFSVFLGGAAGSPWREELLEHFDNSFDIVFINPITDDYDESKEDAFTLQTNWEHTGLIKSTLNIFYFSNKSLAPITLAEMGFYRSKDFIIALESGYEKEEYIKYVAQRYGKPIVSTIKELSQIIKIRYTINHHQD